MNEKWRNEKYDDLPGVREHGMNLISLELRLNFHGLVREP
jgi:hypothetical protein